MLKNVAEAQDNVGGFAIGALCVLSIAGLALFGYKRKQVTNTEFESLLEVEA